ncbi:hypothetical protein PQX77_003044 [Marasmius sp. AFHP31]|nr:hypothetical protein PQX77_003044 [Marasmius sp. AFHP31]
MSEPPNIGDTLSGGIQEVSALLPLLGTEQCERHVGTALEKGYLFAAAAPLSIFGSLGIVKTAFATLLGTTTKPFYGGWWLSDAGFGTTGSVSSMVTLVKDTKQYGAEVRLQRLLKEQHIDDLELVKGIERFGWRRKNVLDVTDKNSTDGSSVKLPPFMNLSWNTSLILSSMVLSLVGVTPYLYLIHNHWGRVLLWLFPVLRSFGSMLCVVSVQLALQIRIHCIATTSLLLMKARKRHPLKINEAMEDRDTLLEIQLQNLQRELADPEKAFNREHLTELQGVLEAHSLSEDAFMVFLKVALVLGMAMIVAGYVGCFNMVSRTDVPNGPYVWFGMETGLAILRIVLWGWNPPWDEGNTGMTMQLALHSKDLTSDITSTTISTISQFPLITTPHYLSQLISPIDYVGYWGKESKETFVAESAGDFLAAATAFVGPLPRLDGEGLEGISLYYGIVPDISETCERKLLCMTVARSDSKWTSVSVFINGDNSHTVFTSHSQDYPGTRALRVALDTEVELDSVAVIDRGTLDLLLDYSFRLFSRLCTAETSSGSQLALSWNVTLPPSLDPGTIRESIPLMKFDKEYLRMRQIYDLKSDYCLQRGASILGFFPTTEVREWGHMLDSAVMEVYLCVLEHRFVQPISPSPTHLRPLALEWVQAMEDRISLDKEGCRRRWSGSTEAFRLFEYEATYDILVRELRSLRHLHGNSIIIQRWGDIMDHSDQSPSVSELFALPPLHNLEKLRKALFPLFTVNGQANVPTPVYRKMILLLRTSLSRLSDVKASSPLYNRIDPYGPGSPEFGPPYTKIRQASEANLNALSLQINSVQILEFHPWGSTVYDLLRLLVALPPSPSLASLLFYNTSFSNEDLLLIPSVLQRHRRIMSVLFDGCGSVERTHIDQAIAANRRKWKEDARNGGEFEYIIGCDFNAAHGNKDYFAFSIYQHEIHLTDRTDVFAMIYIPRPGKITLNLSAKPSQHPIVNFIALLTQSASSSVEEVGVTSDNTHTVRFDVVETDSPGLETVVSVEGFPELGTGCYELRIQNSFNFLFRELTIEFTERPADKESDENSNSGSGEVEDARKAQEGEEANGRENSSVEVKEQPRRSLELRPGTQGKELGDYLGLSWSTVEHSLRDYEIGIICWNMFPDPALHAKFCADIWNYRNTRLGLRFGELPFSLTTEVRCLMVKRAPQIKRVSCEKIEPFIVPMFGFNTNTHQGEVVRANQKKYALLATNFGWYYKDPENKMGYMEHPIIVTAICKALFYNETAHGTLLEWHAFFRPIRQTAIAFLFTLIDHCLSKWSSGKYVDQEMEEDKLSSVYSRHLTRIDEWLKLDEVLTEIIRMGWTIQGLAHAKSFPQDKSKIESGSESHTKADSAAGSGSQPENKAERPSSSGENTVELRPGPDTASEDTQGELALEGPGRDLGDASRASQAQTEARSESFQPDNGVELTDRENALQELQPTSLDEGAAHSGPKPFTDSAEDHNALEESPRPGSSLGYADETKEDEKGESTLASPSRGVDSVSDLARAHGG